MRGNLNSKCFRYQSFFIIIFPFFLMLMNISFIYFPHKIILLDPYPKERNKFIDV